MLGKRILRDLRHNLFRYLAVLVIIVLSMAIVVAYGNTTYSVDATFKEYWDRSNVEDGEFSLYVPLTSSQVKDLNEIGASVEETFYLDLPAEQGTTVRIFKDRKNINKVNVEVGKGEPLSGEIVLEKVYAQDQGFNVGDNIKINNSEYKIIGIGTVPDYCHRVAEISDVGTDDEFGLGFVNEEEFENMCNSNIKGVDVKYNYTYVLDDKENNKKVKEYLLDMEVDERKITDTYVKDMIRDIRNVKNYINTGFTDLEEGSEQIANGIIRMQNQFQSSLTPSLKLGFSGLYQGSSELAAGLTQIKGNLLKILDDNMAYKFNNLSAFEESTTNTRVRDCLDSHQSFYTIALVTGVLFALLIAYILSVFAAHAVEKDSVVIGTLYAMGYRKKELVGHYIKLPVAVVSVGAIVGSFLGVQLTKSCIIQNYSHPEIQIAYPIGLMIYSIGMPIIMVIVINLIVLSKRLQNEPLKLLRKEKKQDKISQINIGNMQFIRCFQVRQLLKDKRNNIIMVLGLSLAVIIMMLGISLYTSINYYADSVADDMQYNYMYTLKNPLSKQPHHTETGYTKGFTMYCPMAGIDLPVVLQGVESNSQYFSFANELENDINKVYVSDSAVVKYGYKVGDKVVFTDALNNVDYAFTVAGTVSFKNGIYFFMNKDAMEKFFNPTGHYEKEEDRESDYKPYYNTLFSDETIEVPSAMLVNVVEKQKVLEVARSWGDDSIGTLSIFVVLSIIIFVLVMYLLVKNRIESAIFNVSLMKIFGFRKREIEKMYLGSLKYLVFLTIIITFPIGTRLMVYLIPVLNATMKSGLKFYMSGQGYLIVISIITCAYLFTRILLDKKLKDISLVAVLKDRE